MEANFSLVLYFAIFFIIAFTRASGNNVRNGVENDSKRLKTPFLNRADRNDWSQISRESKSSQLDTSTSYSKYTLNEDELDNVHQLMKKRRQHIGKRYIMN